MARLIPFDRHHRSESISKISVERATYSIITFLQQRVSRAPCSKILFYLTRQDLLRLRLVSRFSEEEKKLIRSFTEQQVRFVVDGSEECNAAMTPSYVALGWRSISFRCELEQDDIFLAFQSLDFLAKAYKAQILDLTVDVTKLFNHYFSHGEERYLTPLLKDVRSLTVVSSQPDQQCLSKALPHFSSLEEIDLSHYTELSRAVVSLSEESLHQVFSKIEKLTLLGTKITSQALTRLLNACYSLNSLNLNGCEHISAVIDQMAEKQVKQVFGQLEELDLAETGITQETLFKIASSEPPLKALSLYDCKNISGFYEHEGILKNLRFLNLGNTDIVSRRLLNILSSCKNLEQLFLTGCTNVSKTIESLELKTLSEIAHRLEVLDLQGTKISEKALSTLLRACRSLRFVDVTDCEALPAALASLTDDEMGVIFGRVLEISLTGIDADDSI